MSSGKMGSTNGRFAVLLLTTTGRTSGQPRRVALNTIEENGRWHVAGSFAGQPRDPAWVLNLRADPHATVSVRGLEASVVARWLEGEERDAMFERFVALDDGYAVYRERTDRVIPVVELRADG
jgi:deazaflavin-dependent oxidoreductase (nitroreductase family)